MTTDKKSLLEKIKGLFDAPVAPVAPAAPADVVAPVLAAAKTYKLIDGTEISVAQAGDAIAVGDTVTVGGMPPAAGEWELEDGSKITVDELGIITVVTPVEPVTAAVDPLPTLEERLKSLEDKINAMSTPAVPTGLATEVQLQEAVSKMSKQDEVIKHMLELCDLLVEQPTGDPATLSESQKQKFEKVSAKDKRLQALQANMKKIKTQYQ